MWIHRTLLSCSRMTMKMTSIKLRRSCKSQVLHGACGRSTLLNSDAVARVGSNQRMSQSIAAPYARIAHGHAPTRHSWKMASRPGPADREAVVVLLRHIRLPVAWLGDCLMYYVISVKFRDHVVPRTAEESHFRRQPETFLYNNHSVTIYGIKSTVYWFL